MPDAGHRRLRYRVAPGPDDVNRWLVTEPAAFRVRDHVSVCDGHEHGHDHHDDDEARAARPREIAGDAVDPIALEPVDEVVITTLVDNSYDALMGDTGPARRAPFPGVASVPAPQFEEGRTFPGLIAEHGFSALVTTRRGATSHTRAVRHRGVTRRDGDQLRATRPRCGRDRGRGAQPRPPRSRWRLPRAGPVAGPQRAAAHRAPAGLEPAPPRP